jgi:ABC-2 type transport system ATP-binding protein
MTNAIKAINLSKVFESKKWFSKVTEKKVAVDNLSCSIEQGESVAFLGRNGAGKSTVIKLLCGILSPTSGTCEVAGDVSGSLSANKNLGLVFGTRSQLWLHLTIRECLNISAEIYGVTGKEKLRRISELTEIFEIGHLMDQRARTLSLGERMRCELVVALIHHPKILLADEPTVGLDVLAKNHFREIMKRWQSEKNMTLILTSHDCDDVELLCQRSILIESGKIEYDGSLEGLKGDLNSIRRIIVTFSERILNIESTERFKCTKENDYRWCFEINLTQLSIIDAVNFIFKKYQGGIKDINIEEVPLHEVISQLFMKDYTYA